MYPNSTSSDGNEDGSFKLLVNITAIGSGILSATLSVTSGYAPSQYYFVCIDDSVNPNVYNFRSTTGANQCDAKIKMPF